jgi:hypothetical protein
MAAAQTAALKNCAPIRSRHALSKSMDAHAAANLGLIRTFGHSSFLTLKIIAVLPYLAGKSSTTKGTKGRREKPGLIL